EDGIRDFHVTGVQTCALPISTPATISTSTPSSSCRCSASHDTRCSLTYAPCSSSSSSSSADCQLCLTYSPVHVLQLLIKHTPPRSEERRVGKEGRDLRSQCTE